MTDSNAFALFCISFIIGVFCNSIFYGWNFFVSSILFTGVVFIFLCLISVFLYLSGRQEPAIFFMCFLFLMLGMFCFQNEYYFSQNSKLTLLATQNINQEVNGIIIDEPQEKDGKVSFRLQPKGSKANILVQSKSRLDLVYGDQIMATGILSLPPVFKDFDYRRYLAKDRTYAQMFDPQIQIIAKNKGNYFYGLIIAFRQRARETIKVNLYGLDGQIVQAFLLGDKSLDDSFKEALNRCGLSHIIAISGAHIAMFIAIFLPILLAFGLWRQQAMGLMLGFILFFLALSAFQVSAVRSVIMGGLVIIAGLLGRKSDSLRLLLFAAAFMLAFNPLLLGSDVGFQLSFSAVAGLAILSRWWDEKLRFVPQFGFLELRSILSMTMSALIFSWPIISYNFGTLSSVSLPANILANPAMPFLMFFSVISIIVGLLWPILGIFVALPCKAILAYLKLVVYFFGSLPFAQVSYRLPFFLYFFYYILLFWAIFLGRKRLDFL